MATSKLKLECHEKTRSFFVIHVIHSSQRRIYQSRFSSVQTVWNGGGMFFPVEYHLRITVPVDGSENSRGTSRHFDGQGRKGKTENSVQKYSYLWHALMWCLELGNLSVGFLTGKLHEGAKDGSGWSRAVIVSHLHFMATFRLVIANSRTEKMHQRRYCIFLAIGRCFAESPRICSINNEKKNYFALFPEPERPSVWSSFPDFSLHFSRLWIFFCCQYTKRSKKKTSKARS